MFGKPRGGPRGPQRAPPVKEGEELDVIIEAVGEKGDGIAKKDGFILFVKGTKQGETCRIRVTKVLEKVGFAEKIGEAQKEPKPSRPPRHRPKAIVPEPVVHKKYEDTEDFGAELEEDEALPPGATKEDLPDGDDELELEESDEDDLEVPDDEE